MKSASEVVENVFIGSMVVLGRVVDTSGVISFELVAQEEKIRDTANAPNSFFILLEQFTSIVEYLYQHALLPAKTIAAMSARVAKVTLASSLCMKEFLWSEWPIPIA